MIGMYGEMLDQIVLLMLRYALDSIFPINYQVTLGVELSNREMETGNCMRKIETLALNLGRYNCILNVLLYNITVLLN